MCTVEMLNLLTIEANPIRQRVRSKSPVSRCRSKFRRNAPVLAWAVVQVASILLGALLLNDISQEARAQETACAVPVPGGNSFGTVFMIRETNDGIFAAAQNGVLRYTGSDFVTVPGGAVLGIVFAVQETKAGVLAGGMNGIARYDGSKFVLLQGSDTVGFVNTIQENHSGIFLGGTSGPFRYDGSKFVPAQSSAVTGDVFTIQETSAGVFAAGYRGVFHYNGSTFLPVSGGELINGRTIQETKAGIFAGGDAESFDSSGLLRYDGSKFLPVQRADPPVFVPPTREMAPEVIGPLRSVETIRETTAGILAGGDGGISRYDGSKFVPISGGTGFATAKTIQETKDGLFAGVSHDPGLSGDLLRYDGTQFVTIPGGDSLGQVSSMQETGRGLLATGVKGVARIWTTPLTGYKIDLTNWNSLYGASPARFDVPTNWTMSSSCSPLAEQFGLKIVATDENGKVIAEKAADSFHHDGDTVSFQASLPIHEAGRWTFRVVSTKFNGTVGKPAPPVAFVTPGFAGSLAFWWRTIAASAVTLLVGLNLLVLAAARYSPAAWRLATDESWGKSVLLPQRLLLSYWRPAQLWILDLYVQKWRKECPKSPDKFLPLPLTIHNGETSDSASVLARLAKTRRLWIQGNTGMGKTAIYQHLRQDHFCRTESTSFAIFRRDGYVLIPIEARRFPEAPFSEERGASAWVVACARSILSERGLSFTDHDLMRAILSKGTLAIAIDGLNEVAREPAVTAFAAEFPAVPVLITSQESGEPPFEVWRLPATIHEHVDALLTLYLGEQRGGELAAHVRESGLMQHLRSGYDVRLIIELAGNTSPSQQLPQSLPLTRLELYRAAVTAAWPQGDDRLELLQAAAWKLLSERGPNEDKKRLIPDADAPGDLLAKLAEARERDQRSIRLVRPSPPGYEFIHDQMNSYLAACWFANRPTVAVMRDLLVTAKVWQEGKDAQRTLWDFVAEMLDQPTLQDLWIFAGDDDRRAILGSALTRRAERESWTLTRPPAKPT